MSARKTRRRFISSNQGSTRPMIALSRFRPASAEGSDQPGMDGRARIGPAGADRLVRLQIVKPGLDPLRVSGFAVDGGNCDRGHSRLLSRASVPGQLGATRPVLLGGFTELIEHFQILR